MSKTASIRIGLFVLAALALTACGGGGGGGSAVALAPSIVPSLESQFGTGFNTDFFASANSNPAVPMAGDIIALNLTTQPVPLH